LIGGAVVGSHRDLVPLHDARKILGGCMDPWTAFLLQRGMRTLAVRMQAHVAHARIVAEALRAHPRVKRVLWPGFETEPWILRQLEGGGAMLSFEVEGGDENAERIHDALETFVKGGSLGGVESLVSLPKTTSHRGMTDAERAARGITPGLIRLSVGLEDPDDLVTDLRQALERIRS